MQQCRARGVPIPPPFTPGEDCWVGRGPIQHPAVSGHDQADVFTCTTEQGTCVALPRWDENTQEIKLLGVICAATPDADGNQPGWQNPVPVDPSISPRLTCGGGCHDRDGGNAFPTLTPGWCGVAKTLVERGSMPPPVDDDGDGVDDPPDRSGWAEIVEACERLGVDMDGDDNP